MVGEGMVTLAVLPGPSWLFRYWKSASWMSFHVAHLVDHAHHRRGQLLGAVGADHGDRDVGLHAAQLLEKVDVEIGAAELAVGDALAGPRLPGTSRSR
jgi:hypothetical protein